MTQLAGGAEVQDLAVKAAVEDNGRIAQWAIGHSHRHAAQLVVDDFVPGQDAQRIGPGLAVDD